jgi:hypothetical protein
VHPGLNRINKKQPAHIIEGGQQPVATRMALLTCLSDAMTPSTAPLKTSGSEMWAQQRPMISLLSLRSSTCERMDSQPVSRAAPR